MLVMDSTTISQTAWQSAMQEKAAQHPAAAKASFFLQIGLRSFAGGNPAAALTQLQVPSWLSASRCMQRLLAMSCSAKPCARQRQI